MRRDEIERALAAAIDAESQAGLRWWPGAEMASIAFRRWVTLVRRHPSARTSKAEDQVLDLAKGLQAHFEPGAPYTHKSEWRHLAEILARVLVSENPAGPGAT